MFSRILLGASLLVLALPFGSRVHADEMDDPVQVSKFEDTGAAKVEGADMDKDEAALMEEFNRATPELQKTPEPGPRPTVALPEATKAQKYDTAGVDQPVKKAKKSKSKAKHKKVAAKKKSLKSKLAAHKSNKKMKAKRSVASVRKAKAKSKSKKVAKNKRANRNQRAL